MPLEARKIGFAAARKAGHGKKQLRRGWTTATAQPGDWIVTNLSPDREILRDQDGRENTCVINVENFPNIDELIDGAKPIRPVHQSEERS